MTATQAKSAKRRWPHWGWALGAILLFAGFLALGSWQVQRRIWKLDLIERVNQRVTASAVDIPASVDWPYVNSANDEYQHVQVTGRFLVGLDARVQAVTTLGSGFWLISPLQMANGDVVLINRGFLLPQPAPMPFKTYAPSIKGSKSDSATVTIKGLLRLTEPGGGFLRSNDPAAERWFSRDVKAIAEARDLRQVAPFFIDAGPADADAPVAPTSPIGGLTVIAFHNSHLVYALTWYALALMVAGAAIGLTLHNTKHDDLPKSENSAD